MMGHNDSHCDVQTMHSQHVTSMEHGFGHQHISHFAEMLEIDHRPCFNYMGVTRVRGINTDWWICDFSGLGHQIDGTLAAAGVHTLELFFSEARWTISNDMEKRVPVRAVAHGTKTVNGHPGQNYQRTIDFIGFEHDESEKDAWKRLFTPPYEQCKVSVTMPVWPDAFSLTYEANRLI